MTTSVAATPPHTEAPNPVDAPFTQTLIRTLRAHDPSGIWDKLGDEKVLGPFIVTREQRRAMPIIDNPGPEVIGRLRAFYGSVGLAIEQQAGVMASPIMEVSSEGFGRVVLTAGRLVLLNKSLRDVHRFGFESLAALAAEGGRLVADGVAMINAHPDLARA